MYLKDIENALHAAGIEGVPAFIERLASNSGDDRRVHDYIAEAEAALMFVRGGFTVKMDDRPDLRLSMGAEHINAEVKRFRVKEQDKLDTVALATANRLVPYGDTLESEGKAAWDQVVCVCNSKTKALPEGAANLIVIRSNSPHCIEDKEVLTARNEIEDRLRKDCSNALSRISGLILMSLSSQMMGQNVFHFPVRNAACQLSYRTLLAVGEVKTWHRMTTA